MSLDHYGINVNGYSVRSEMHQGRPHIIVPAVMLRQGVMAGSHGPLLHLIEDYGRFVGAWNGIPVTINHPQEEGVHVSANSPEVIDNQVVGRVYNAFIDGDKLKAEVWIDEGALKQISPEALAMIRRAEPMDVSVGVFTDDESVSGDWNGTEYQAIARNHRPDHLSLLPGGVGACSFSAGCGLRANEKGGAMADISEAKVSLEDVFKGLQPGDYRLKDDGSVDPIVSKPKEVATMAEKKEVKGCCPEKVELLIQDKATKWEEDDRALLLTMSAEQLEKITPAPAETKETPAPPVVMSKEQAIQVLQEQLGDPEKFLALLPAETRASVQHGLGLYKAQRAQMIEKITTASPDVYTADELNAMSMDALEKVAKVAKIQTDFTPLGGGNGNPAAYEGEALLPPGVE